VRRVLYVSQLCAFDHPDRHRYADESVSAPDVFAALGVQLTFVDVTRDPLPDPSGWEAVVVGGSLGSANDPEPWRRGLEAWMAACRRPLFGICGGHQLLARALGGRVEPMGHRQSGVHPLALPDVPGFRGSVLQMHGDHVTALPACAEPWAHDGVCLQAARYPNHTWTVQFHPEVPAVLARHIRDNPVGEPVSGDWSDASIERAAEDGRAILRAWILRWA
jgi:GMP synthase-like glutamine amidotransferase